MDAGRGAVHIYCGNGKGKTTAAMGLCVRAAGSGKQVLIYQFMKGNSSSELYSLARLPEIFRIDGPAMAKFTFQMTPEERQQEYLSNNERFRKVVDRASEYDVLFCDELLYAIDLGLLDERLVLNFLRTRPALLEVVLTGRNPSQSMIEAADYVTEMKKIKHPFDCGWDSRQGIEF